MFLDQHQVRLNDLRSLRTFCSGIVSPLQYFVDFPIKLFNNLQLNFSTQQSLLDDNANLKDQVLILQGQLQQYFSLEKENNQLRSLLQSSPRGTERYSVARILAVDPEPFTQQLILDKGEKNGVYIGQPVLDADGVFGQIIYVAPYTSRVLLITDTLSAIPVEDMRSSLRGLVLGRGNGQNLVLANMPESADIKPGDSLVTSGLGGDFPAGYPVGTVIKIERNSGEGFSHITVEPSAQLNRSRLVLLVWPLQPKTIIPPTKNITQQNDAPTKKGKKKK